jgi:HTH-type transcriptional regulator/antitoxin HigA
MLKPIKSPRQHRAALKRIDRLMEAGADSPEAAELEVLAILVERYERETFPIDPPLLSQQR